MDSFHNLDISLRTYLLFISADKISLIIHSIELLYPFTWRWGRFSGKLISKRIRKYTRSTKHICILNKSSTRPKSIRIFVHFWFSFSDFVQYRTCQFVIILDWLSEKITFPIFNRKNWTNFEHYVWVTLLRCWWQGDCSTIHGLIQSANHMLNNLNRPPYLLPKLSSQTSPTTVTNNEVTVEMAKVQKKHWFNYMVVYINVGDGCLQPTS